MALTMLNKRSVRAAKFLHGAAESSINPDSFARRSGNCAAPV